MPHPSSRLDLYLIPRGSQAEVRAALTDLLSRWSGLGWVRGSGEGTEGMRSVVCGGCVRVRVDLPGALVLYANQQGGFRVKCGRCGHNLSSAVPELRRAFSDGERARCEGCDEALGRDLIEFQPPGAFGYGAMVLCDVGGVEMTSQAHDELMRTIGPYDVVGRRT